MPEVRRVLVFSPHFDDEAIGCGGTIARHAAAGDELMVVYMTRGNCGSLLTGMDSDASGQVRRAEAERAARVLGVTKIMYLDLDEGFITYDAEVIKRIIVLIREFKPQFVYAPHAEENLNDHQVTSQLVHTGVFYASWKVFPDLGSEAHLTRETRYYEVWTPLAAPNLFVNISGQARIKEKAILCYESQVADVPYQRAILGLNRYRGLMMAGGVEYAEAFLVKKMASW